MNKNLSDKKIKILITGAHFTPAVAVIEVLKTYSNVEIVYVGRKTTREGDTSLSAESQILPKLGVKFIPIITGRFQRAFTFYTIPSLFKIPIGLIQSFFIVIKEKPDVVLSFGGYVAVPIVVVSYFLSIPIILHEQTLVSGLANKISSIFADRIALSFKKLNPGASKYILTGNPIREDVLNANLKPLSNDIKKLICFSKLKKLPIVFITGGNQGSHIINLAVEGSLKRLTKIACVVHQTGESKYHDFERLNKKEINGYLAKKFIDKEMGSVLNLADLVVSRAGVNTLIELAYLGKPTLVIPIPYLYQDEQNKNAKYFERLGLVQILPQKNLTSETFYETVKNMLENIFLYKRKASQAKSEIVLDGAQKLALETLLLVNKKD